MHCLKPTTRYKPSPSSRKIETTTHHLPPSSSPGSSLGCHDFVIGTQVFSRQQPAKKGFSEGWISNGLDCWDPVIPVISLGMLSDDRLAYWNFGWPNSYIHHSFIRRWCGLTSPMSWSRFYAGKSQKKVAGVSHSSRGNPNVLKTLKRLKKPSIYIYLKDTPRMYNVWWQCVKG